MKKLFLFVAAVAMSIAASATDIWTGSKHVSWTDGGIQIAATQFANAKAGDKIVVTYAEATDGIEFKVMNQYFDHLAGSREAAWINGAGTFEQFLTQSAVDSLKAYGLEIIGANFTCSKIELNDGKEPKAGFTVWTGFFWADTWTTLELYWNGYAGVDWNKVTAIRFYSEAANGNYALNFLEGWDEGQKFADQTNMVDGNGYKELTITEDLRSRLANAGHWMIQYNKEALEAFNVTDVVLVMMIEPEYYLVGSMNEWTINENYKFEANIATAGEYMLATTLTEGAAMKVTSNKGDWFPGGMGNDYVVDADHAGEVVVYFRPDGQGGEGWYNGFFYVEVQSGQGFDNTVMESKATKTFENGQLVIIKNGVKYNALGAEMK